MDKQKKEIEQMALSFAGQLTQSWADTLLFLISNSGEDNQKMLNRMLMQMRDAGLASVDAIERKLGISPTTAEIRKWFKQEKHGQDFEEWTRKRS